MGVQRPTEGSLPLMRVTSLGSSRSPRYRLAWFTGLRRLATGTGSSRRYTHAACSSGSIISTTVARLMRPIWRSPTDRPRPCRVRIGEKQAVITRRGFTLNTSKLIHHPTKRGMAPFLNFDPAVEPAAAVRALSMLEDQPSSPIRQAWRNRSGPRGGGHSLERLRPKTKQGEN